MDTSQATIIYNSSTLAFTPLAMFAIYSASKAALHSYAISQRFMLRNSTIRVKEIAPPWVATGLVGAKDDPNAMPLDRFIESTLNAMAIDADEVLVEEALMFRNNMGPNEHQLIASMNEIMTNFFNSNPQG